MPQVMQVRNSRLTPAIAAAAVRAGAQIRERTTVEALPEGRVVVATGAWAGPPVTPARGQMILVTGGKIRSALLWKDRYIIPRLDGRLLLGSTVEDVGFDARTTDDGLRAIREAAIRMAPKVAELPVERAWAGLRPRTPDRLPIIGAEGRVIHATGHFRNGILLAPITARLVREIVEERRPSIGLEPFAPRRFARKR
jgi:glycine oxidase